MAIPPFGWKDNSDPALTAENLEAMHAASGSYSDTKVAQTQVGVANGIGTLDSTGRQPISQSPQSVQSVAQLAPATSSPQVGQAVVWNGTAWTSSGVAPASLPTNAGARAGRFNPLHGSYNVTAANTVGLRIALSKALQGSLVPITFVGDSKTAGLGSSSSSAVSVATEGGWPGQLLKLLGARGYPIAGTGLVSPNQNAISSSGTNDPRWNLGTGWSAPTSTNTVLAQAATTGAVSTFTSNRAGTNIDIYVPNTSGPFSYAIDGGASVVYTPSGTTMNKIALSGLTNATHTVTITTTSTTTVYLMGVDVYNPSGLKFNNLGISSSESGDWAGNVLPTYHNLGFANFLNAPVTFLSLGINDSQHGKTVASFVSNMQSLVENFQSLSSAVVLVVASGPSPSAVTPWDGFVAATYGLADQYDLPLIDLTAVLTQDNITTAQNNGLIWPSQVHETALGYQYEAATIASLIA